MANAQTFLPEFDREMISASKILERVPDVKKQCLLRERLDATF